MATRLYLNSAGAAGVIPNAQQSSGKPGYDFYESDSAGSMTPLKMTTTAGAAKVTIGGANRAETKTTTYAHWMKCWVSDPIAAQTIDTAGTFTLVLNQYEGQAQHNTYPRIYIYVWKADDTGIRGTLFAEAASATECGTVATTNTTFWNAADIANSVVCSAGDRIVIEIASYCNQPSTTSDKQVTIGYDAAAAAAGCSYLELSQNITFGGVSYKQVCTAGITVGHLNDAANVIRFKKKFAKRLQVGSGIIVSANITRRKFSKRIVQGTTVGHNAIKHFKRPLTAQGITVTDNSKKNLKKRLGMNWPYALWDNLIWYSDGYHNVDEDLLDCSRNGGVYPCQLTNATVGDTGDGPYHSRDGNWHSTMFDAASTDYGVITGSENSWMDTPNAITVFAWVKPKSTGQANVSILARDQDASVTVFKMGLWGAGNVPNFGINLHLGANSVDWTGAIDTNWHFIVGVYDRTEGKIKISVDGGTFQTFNYNTAMATGQPVMVGRNNQWGGYCNMYLGPFGILGKALTQSEVTLLYTSPWGFGNLDAEKPYSGFTITDTIKKKEGKRITQSIRVTATVGRLWTGFLRLVQGLNVHPGGFDRATFYQDCPDHKGYSTNFVEGGAGVYYACFQGPALATYIMKYQNRKWGTPVKIADSTTTDAHCSPAICRDAAGYLHVFINGHSSDHTLRYYKSTNPDDISAWTNKTVALGKNGVYASAFYDPAQDMVAVLYRTDTFEFWIAATTDGGDNWADIASIIDNDGDKTPYAVGNIWAETTAGHFYIHIVFNFYSIADAVRGGVYYLRYNLTDFQTEDVAGNDLTASTPLAFAACDASATIRVFAYNAANETDGMDFSKGPDGTPMLTFSYKYNVAPLYHAVSLEYTGGSWQNQRTIAETNAADWINTVAFPMTTKQMAFLTRSGYNVNAYPNVNRYTYDWTAKAWTQGASILIDAECYHSGVWWLTLSKQTTSNPSFLFQENWMSTTGDTSVGVALKSTSDDDFFILRDQTLVKRFWMRFSAQNAGRPQQGVTVGFTVKKKLKKRLTAQGMTVTASVLKRYAKRLNQGATVGSNLIKKFKKKLSQGFVATDNVTTSKWGTVAVKLEQGVRVAANAFKKTAKKLNQSVKVSSNSFKKLVRRLSQGATVGNIIKKKVGKRLSQGVKVVDNVSRRVFFKKIVAQGIKVTDNVQKRAKHVVSQGVTVGANSFKRFKKVLNHGIRVTDNVSSSLKQVLKQVVVQGITVTANSFKRFKKVLTQSMKVAATERNKFTKRINQGVTVTATVAKKLKRVLSQGITVATTPFRKLGKRISQGVKVSANISRKAFKKVIAQGVRVYNEVLPLLAGSLAKKLSQGITITDRVAKKFTKRINDSFKLGFELTVTSLAGLLKVTLAQGIKVADNLRKKYKKVLTVGSGITITAVLGRKGLARVITQGINVNATTTKRFKKVITQGATVTTRMFKSLRRKLSQGLSVTDSIRKRFGKRTTQGISVTFDLRKKVKKALTQSIKVTASMLKRIALKLSQGVKVTPAVFKRFKKAITQGARITATLSKRLKVKLSQGIRVADATVKKYFKKVVAQGIRITASASANLGILAIYLHEGIRVTAESFKTFKKVITQGTRVADAVAVGRILIIALSEGLTAAFTMVKRFRKVLTPTAFYVPWDSIIWASDGETYFSLPKIGGKNWRNMARGSHITTDYAILDVNAGTATGHYIRATEFTGLFSGGSIQGEAKYNLTDEITVMMWINPHTALQNCGLLAKNEDDTTIPWILGLFNGKPYFMVNNHLGNNGPTWGVALDPDQWYQIVGTYNRNTGLVKLYVNDGAPASAAYAVAMAVSADDIVICQKNFLVGVTYFHGDVDDVVIANKEWQQNDIASLYHSKSGLNICNYGDPTGIGITDNWKQGASNWIRRFVQGLLITDVSPLVIKVYFTIKTVTTFGTFGRPTRQAELSCMVQRADNSQIVTGATVTAQMRKPDGTVYRQLSLTEDSIVPGLYKSTFRIYNSDTLGTYPLTITATKNPNTSTYEGYIIIYPQSVGGIYYG